MKHINQIKKPILLRIKNRRRDIVLARKGKKTSIVEDITLKAPSVLSISNNSNQTIRFFENLKSNALERKIIKRKGKWYSSNLFVDLSTISKISVPSAIILSAELHRWSIHQGVRLKARKLKHWEPRVAGLLNDLGCFSLLSITDKNIGDKATEETITLLKLRSGIKTDGKKIDALQRDLSTIFRAFKAQPYIYDGLSEATNNCLDHAYKSVHGTEPKYPYAGHRWWATACYDPNSKSLRFFVYDQGVGIPKTLSGKLDWLQELTKLLGPIVNSDDASIIEGAFEVGRTSTGLSGRGRGLNDMWLFSALLSDSRH